MNVKELKPKINNDKSQFVFMLVLPIPTTCEHFMSFGALLDTASLFFFHHNFQNKQNLSGPIAKYRSTKMGLESERR